MVPILRRFRIIRCNRQAALHSALFNYNPLVIRGTSKNKQLTIVKPTQTGIYRNKYTFCPIKSLEPLKFKHQSRPLVRSSSLNFGQNFWNLSHETVPLKDDNIGEKCFTFWADIFKKYMGAGNRVGKGYCTGPLGYIVWRNWLIGIDSWAS